MKSTVPPERGKSSAETLHRGEVGGLSLDDFDFHLPPQAIAQRPAPRGASRLFEMTEGESRHWRFDQVGDLLHSGDLLVLNDTRVFAARLHGRFVRGPEAGAERGGKLEILLVEPLSPTIWSCLVRPGRAARPGRWVRFFPPDDSDDLGDSDESSSQAPSKTPSDAPCSDSSDRSLLARFVERREELFILEFNSPPADRLDELGEIPLPPYIGRPADKRDHTDYQTVYANAPGAVAAPTAGLHFSATLLDRLRAQGVGVATVTLHVGPGTFRPVQGEISRHRIGGERYEIHRGTVAAIAAARARGGRVIAVGTTVVRTLESAVDEQGVLATCAGRTELFIQPGFRFRVVDALITNFHLPRSTLLMLVSAFAGHRRVLDAYREAVACGYRFYSYGDAMFVLPDPAARMR